MDEKDPPHPQSPSTLDYHRPEVTGSRENTLVIVAFGAGLLFMLLCLFGWGVYLGDFDWPYACAGVGLTSLFYCVPLLIFGRSCNERRAQGLAVRRNGEARALCCGVVCAAGALLFGPWMPPLFPLVALAYTIVFPIIATFIVFEVPATPPGGPAPS